MLDPPEHDGDHDRAVGPATSDSARSRPRPTTLPALALALVLVALTTAACGGASAQRAKVGEPAPPITGTTLDGTPFDLADYRGRPVVVNFWGSYCPPCREEFPLFRDRLEALGPSDDLAMVGVLFNDSPDLARRFLDEVGASWPTVTDPDDAIADAYRVVAAPQTYFIDADGVLRGMQIGEVRPEDFDAQYAKIRP